MSRWRNQILKEFTPQVSRLTLVSDPDGLLLEERILEDIRERGFELIPFEDHIAFRYAYESKFRSRWDRGEQIDLVVVLRSPANDFSSIPYDLLQAGRKLSFNLGEIFPNLSYPVVASLDRGDLDALYEAQINHAPGMLGDNATKEFVLRHVFEIAPELIKQPSNLLSVLLRRHYRGQRIPEVLDERFIQILRQNDTFAEWSLEVVIREREAFFLFLQERWPVFLDRVAKTKDSSIKEDKKPYGFTIAGPVDLPFDHDDIRIYMDNLFLEGILQSVPHTHSDSFAKSWMSTGIKADPEKDRARRLNKLTERLQSSIPTEDARYSEWLHFARGWAELTMLFYGQEDADSKKAPKALQALQPQIDIEFAQWLAKRYTGLINLPPTPPVMVHHIPRFLARQIEEDQGCKIALIVVDGLSLDQWIVIQGTITSRRSNLLFRESAIFSWVPTVTSISRQAIFAGKPPIFFPSSIHYTSKEPALWMQFWVDQGFSKNEVVYKKGLGNDDLDNIDELLFQPKVKVAGLVIDKVDKIMHGMELGAAGMINQVRQWSQQGYLDGLFDLLLGRGFSIFLTSDHGNIEAEGCGRPAEGVIPDLRGERVRVYTDTPLLNKAYARIPGAIKWKPIGLPENYFSLIAPNRKAFVNVGERVVSHGGISIEELIVPLVQVERRDT